MFKTILILLALFYIGGSLYSGTRKTIEERITIKSVTNIDIYSVSGTLNIIPEDRDDIFVSLETSTWGPKLYIDEGKSIIIEAKKKGLAKLFWSFKPSVLNVYIPISYGNSILARNISGSLNMDNFKLSEIDIKVTSGSIDIKNIEAERGTIKNTSGRIDLTNIAIEEFDVKNTSGRIDIGNFTGSIRARNTSGKISISTDKIVGDIDIKSTSGRVTLSVADKKLNSNLYLKSTSGRVKCDFPITISGDVSNKKIEGQSGDPDYNINITTVSSGISIEARD